MFYCEGQSHKTASTDHNFWTERRAEADLNQGPSAYQPNTLLKGQTGSLKLSHFGSTGIMYNISMTQYQMDIFYSISTEIFLFHE